MAQLTATTRFNHTLQARTRLCLLGIRRRVFATELRSLPFSSFRRQQTEQRNRGAPAAATPRAQHVQQQNGGLSQCVDRLSVRGADGLCPCLSAFSNFSGDSNSNTPACYSSLHCCRRPKEYFIRC